MLVLDLACERAHFSEKNVTINGTVGSFKHTYCPHAKTNEDDKMLAGRERERQTRRQADREADRLKGPGNS